ncbi:MAG: citrate lyase acyl carrier protein [Fusobacteriaceae bacterium]|nr:citrate lyase acyl carrier protein [Fusobacteriaceae bacterium]MBP6322276.1 citrate lyase acyl carrier protein [Fusobacteriaceae bacterium]MBP9509562.1 citrate lyase acyl carrier protein [Fusobacteriaceae bacterium]
MTIKNSSKCGTLESNDIYIVLTPSNDGIEIELESSVTKQFGDEIRAVIEETLKELGVTSVKVNAQDKGALNYTIKARVEGAVRRGGIN